jgi:MFS family permease
MSFLDRDRSIAHPGYSRWLVPPAALAIHLCIGQVYSFSVFKIPLTQLLGVNHSLPEDWKQSQIAWIFSLAIVMLGVSAATFGKWLEGAGPRKAMFASALLSAWVLYFLRRRGDPSVVAALLRIWNHRRYRPRAWLHLPSFYFD